MTSIDDLKIFDDKIKANEVQYNIDRKALSSSELEKYECLTGEDLGKKTRVIENTKFEYSPLGKIFNKGF